MRGVPYFSRYAGLAQLINRKRPNGRDQPRVIQRTDAHHAIEALAHQIDTPIGATELQLIASQTALGRVGPDDIGGVIASLLAPANAWIDAQRIEASGGMLL